MPPQAGIQTQWSIMVIPAPRLNCLHRGRLSAGNDRIRTGSPVKYVTVIVNASTWAGTRRPAHNYRWWSAGEKAHGQFTKRIDRGYRILRGRKSRFESISNQRVFPLQRGKLAGIKPLASFTVIVWSAAIFFRTSTEPLGQWTSKRSILLLTANPK
jgi:hypothetical protein